MDTDLSRPTQPPDRALALYQRGVALVEKYMVPLAYLRVLYWEMGEVLPDPHSLWKNREPVPRHFLGFYFWKGPSLFEIIPGTRWNIESLHAWQTFQSPFRQTNEGICVEFPSQDEARFYEVQTWPEVLYDQNDTMYVTHVENGEK